MHNYGPVERTQYPTGLCHHPDQAKRQAALFFTIEIARNSHSDRDEGAAPDCLHKARGNQPDQAGRKRVGVAEIIGRGNIDADMLQETDIDCIAQVGCQAAEE